jgi:hypothetical protein
MYVVGQSKSPLAKLVQLSSSKESTHNYSPLFAPPMESGQVAQVPALSSSCFVGRH